MGSNVNDGLIELLANTRIPSIVNFRFELNVHEEEVDRARVTLLYLFSAPSLKILNSLTLTSDTFCDNQVLEIPPTDFESLQYLGLDFPTNFLVG